MPSYIPAEALAAVRDPRRSDRDADQPVKRKLDSGVWVGLPGRGILAPVYVLPWLRERFDIYRGGGALMARPKGSTADVVPLGVDQLALVVELHASLASLPELPEAGRPYRDLRLFIAEANPNWVADYLRSALTAVRPLVATWRPPTIRAERGPAKSPAERMAAKRERRRVAEVASATWWLESLLDDDDELEIGERITAAELYNLARGTLADLAADDEQLDEDDPDSPAACVPGPRVFYTIADELLGERRRGAQGAQAYVLSPAFNLARTRSLLRRKRHATALRLQREHYADR